MRTDNQICFVRDAFYTVIVHETSIPSQSIICYNYVSNIYFVAIALNQHVLLPQTTLYSRSNQASIQVITIHSVGLLSPDIRIHLAPYSFPPTQLNLINS